MHGPTYQCLLLWLFIAAICSPLLVMLASPPADISAAENRKLAEFPRWGSRDRSSHFLRWASGAFVVTIYAPDSPTATVEAFVEAYRAAFPLRRSQ